MPKIEVNKQLFFELAGRAMNRTELETALESAKAELDEWNESDTSPDAVIKIELNDTNRPDLWSTAGLARHLRIYGTRHIPAYNFLSTESETKASEYRIVADASVRAVRPYVGGFVVSGKGISDAMLRDAIQTQEKLCSNFGRKRKSLSMGMYRIGLIRWPVTYKAVAPDSASFTPLHMEKKLSLGAILKEHPKGIEYAAILSGAAQYPILMDAAGAILSLAPIINSADIGAVQVNDAEILIEFTGTDMEALALAVNIVACDFADAGYAVKALRVDYSFDTPLGRSITFPYYFQQPASVDSGRVTKLLGDNMGPDKVIDALRNMGIEAEAHGQHVRALPPPYRDDFLHAVDLVEDVMIGRGLASFKPERPSDFTIGRLSSIELYTRKAKDIFVGLGYQEMVYNYLGSGKDYIERMHIAADGLIRISNPMTENYEYVRSSAIPELLQSEAVSSKAAYPHKIFEAGKIAFADKTRNYGCTTKQYLCFLSAHQNADYNEAAGEMATLLYYFGLDYAVSESDDPRFLAGRQADIMAGAKKIGLFGEVHPAVLADWGITVPCVAGELDLEALSAASS